MHKNTDKLQVAFTVDIDWAPDFTIKELADFFLENSVKCTWFITHNSGVIEYLLQFKEMFDFGIHPNFLPNSTQGKNEDEIISNVLKIVNTKIVRTHALVQSSPLLKKFYSKYDLTIDVSLFLPEQDNLLPHRLYLDNSGKYIFRIPYFWEDDVASYIPNFEWNSPERFLVGTGLKIFNLHPMYYHLNMANMQGYEELKKKAPLYTLSPDDTKSYTNTGEGTQTFVKKLVNWLKNEKILTYTITEIYEKYN
ncbi:MAG: hypothetical protein RMJ97_01230 [Raineya sp.]|nr:hypothetical protein [Raineya sp.]MDW8295480.1 hypothetical protein [Raineya sp.]